MTADNRSAWYPHIPTEPVDTAPDGEPLFEPELVPERWGCPHCGERDLDQLVWKESADLGEFVECQPCGSWYYPDDGEG